MINSVESGIPVVMIDMPEILLRMKIGNDFTLDELNKVFNTVANQIKQKKVMANPALAAQQLFPEIFLKPKDDYIRKMLKIIAEDESDRIYRQGEDESSLQSRNILAYLGNMHVSPVSRAWETGTTVTAPGQKQGRKVLKTRKGKAIDDDNLNFAKMMYVYREKNEESPDDQIVKQALLDALMGT